MNTIRATERISGITVKLQSITISPSSQTLMKKLQYYAALASLALLTGCFQSDTLVTVQPDGSGTVTESFVLGKAALDQMKQMTASFAAGFPGAGITNAAKPFDVMDEQKLRAEAGKMGEGVTFVSAKRLTNDSGEGYNVTYAFKDISKLKLNQNKSGNLPQGPQGQSAANGNPAAKDEFITFDFKKGSVAELTIHTPAKSTGAAIEPKEQKEPSAPDNDAMALQMMGPMLKDMRVTLDVQVAGNIEKTDAEYVDGPKVTLMAMDFNHLLADPAKTKALADAQPKGLEDTKKLMHSIPGMKAELKDTVRISFK